MQVPPRRSRLWSRLGLVVVVSSAMGAWATWRTSEPPSSPTPVPTLEWSAPVADRTRIPIQQEPLRLGVMAVVSGGPREISTFALDADTWSRSSVRSALRRGYLPAPEDVRVDTFVQALSYDYPRPAHGLFGVEFEVVPSPWTEGRHLVRVGLRARDLPEERAPLHLTLLVDTSGSMQARLPLVKKSLGALVGALRPTDTIALVQFASQPHTVLAPTRATAPFVLLAIASLGASGGGELAAGLQAAPQLAARSSGEPGAHRVVVCSDGMSSLSDSESAWFIDQIGLWRAEGITVGALGFGRGAHLDRWLEDFTEASGGPHARLDTLSASDPLLGQQLVELLSVVALDPRVHIVWGADAVEYWRLVGDGPTALTVPGALEIGPGQRATALYEVKLGQAAHPEVGLGALVIQAETPGAERHTQTQHFVIPSPSVPSLDEASADTRMAIASASLALHLADSPSAQGMSLASIRELARQAARPGYARDQELILMIERALGARPTPPDGLCPAVPERLFLFLRGPCP